MIDWIRTLAVYGTDKPGYRKRLAVYCDLCDAKGVRSDGSIVLTRIADVIDGQLYWECKRCVTIRTTAATKIACNDTGYKERLSARSKKLWEDQNYRQKVIANNQSPIDPATMSQIMKKVWQDPIKKKNHSDSLQRPEVRDKLSNNAKKMWKKPEYRLKMNKLFSDRSKKLWGDPVYRRKVIATLTDNPKLIASGKRLWRDPIYTQRMVDLHQTLWKDADYRDKMVDMMRRRVLSPIWKQVIRQASIDNNRRINADPELRAKRHSNLSAAMIKRWNNPAQRAALIDSLNSDEAKQKLALAQLAMPRVSSIQTILYSILDDLEIPHFREYQDHPADVECLIGPYSFDCVIPRPEKRTLLVECQGDYWHSHDKVIKRDIRKQSYIINNLSNRYELKCLWEHEFLNKDRVIETVKYWLGITTATTVDYAFSEVLIKLASAVEYRLLLSKYHYLPTAPLGSQSYGAYHGDQLIAVAIFSSVRRQNMEASIGYKNDETRELSRFCINPLYQKQNFGSWFLSRAIKLLPEQYKCIITYADQTFNHDGGLYRACNFMLDKEVPADYWYVAENGWAMHKRTLYGHAKSLKLTEAEFAATHGYKKVYGSTKKRFKLIRSLH